MASTLGLPLGDFGSPKVQKFEVYTTASEFDALLLKLKELVKIRRIATMEFFKDFDRHKKGFCAEAKFLSGLGAMNLEVSGKEMQILANHYRAPPPDQKMIRYSLMCRELEAVFTRRDLHLNPTAKFEDFPIRRPSPTRSPVNSEALTKLLDSIRTRIKQRSVMLLPIFKDFEKNRNSPIKVGHVTQFQFNQVLGMLGFPLQERDFALLHERYFDDRSKCMNYVAFCNDVEDWSSVTCDGDDYLSEQFGR
eukprot:TRINITY_DN1046_c0_g1::TRINITY_DN1046_c0_g1_i2::g.29900::m.29900 TRINITY_DN1046_c0_g1::TRINITY_DN1046_c0_g1_i2::g.29900  ORF type:complete len:250 (-),score=47.06 TRINITY_DN1046_c0_g1_i2:431-1180(-)